MQRNLHNLQQGHKKSSHEDCFSSFAMIYLSGLFHFLCRSFCRSLSRSGEGLVDNSLYAEHSGNNEDNKDYGKERTYAFEPSNMTDAEEAFKVMQEAEELAASEYPVMPIYYRNSTMLMHHNVEGYFVTASNGLLFKSAYVTE